MTTASIARSLAGPDPELVKGIRRASAASGVDFGYLMAQAARESGFRTDARARGSSASGLYQFIDGTWLDLMRRYGAKHGVAADASKTELLALRDDPALSAAMAAEYARDNKATLEAALGREAGRGELALAHFLGAGGATQFLKGLADNSGTKAAALLPEAAAANRAVFYDKDGRPRSVGEIWRDFSQRIEREAAAWSDASPTSVAAADPPATPAVARSSTGFAMSSGVRHASGLSVPRLSRPTLAMLDALAFAALKLIGQEAPAGARPEPRAGAASPTSL